jgi:hypothetical protein
MSKSVIVPAGLFDKVYQYLLEKPYREVSPLVDELKNSVQVADIPEEALVEPQVEESSDD